MRYLCYTLGDPSVQISAPKPELMAEMGAFIQESIEKGILVATGGLAPTSEGVKVAYEGGKFTVTDGPFPEAKEVIGGWALIEVASKEEAVEIAKRFLSIAGGGETRMRPSYGPEDDQPFA